ncbi:hypothetical protein F2Q70_00014662 [Brassica cretica]|uniref:Uncharacterized protein n=1 Tax=Brassica cretica TaxID=69181 RepID=A0A8S9I3B6_BRACR|nr:hypothetical protein F2Q70_00014662 [Brassica cretica]
MNPTDFHNGSKIQPRVEEVKSNSQIRRLPTDLDRNSAWPVHQIFIGPHLRRRPFTSDKQHRTNIVVLLGRARGPCSPISATATVLLDKPSCRLQFATNLRESCSVTTKSPYTKIGASQSSPDLQSALSRRKLEQQWWSFSFLSIRPPRNFRMVPLLVVFKSATNFLTSVVVRSPPKSSTEPISSSCSVELAVRAQQSQPPRPSYSISRLEAWSRLQFATNLRESCSVTTKSPCIKIGASQSSPDLQSPSSRRKFEQQWWSFSFLSIRSLSL